MVTEMKNLIYWQEKPNSNDNDGMSSNSCRGLKDLRNRENLYGFPPIPMGNITSLDSRGRLVVKPRQSRSESTLLRGGMVSEMRPRSDAAYDNYFSRFMNKARSRETSPKRIRGILHKNSYRVF